MLEKNTVSTLQQFWTTLSGWHDVRQFGRIFLFILRKPFRHTVQVFKSIEAAESYRFYVQSFIIFTTLTSFYSAFKGNDILKNIIMMLNQLIFLTLGTMLYFVIFNRLSKVKREFSEFLKLYSLYMGFILPFLAIGSLLNWQIVLTLTDPANLRSAPDPVRFLPTMIGAMCFAGFGLYYSLRMIRYFWDMQPAVVITGMLLVFLLLTPLQRLWISGQCAVGITPDFAFNNLSHQKATLRLLGCENQDCRSCLLLGNWKWSEATLLKHRQKQEAGLFNLANIESEMEARKNMYVSFDENGRYSERYTDANIYLQEYSTPWFFSKDGSQLFFGTHGYEVLYLSNDSIALRYEDFSLLKPEALFDTLFLVPAR